MTQDALTLLDRLCDSIAADKYAVLDKSDIDAAVHGDGSAAMLELVSGGHVIKKYDDGEEVCLTVTVKGRNLNEELKAMSLHSDKDSTVVRTDAAGRPVVVIDNGDKGFEKQIKKIAGSGKAALVFGLIGGLIGGIVGGVIVALIMHFALA